MPAGAERRENPRYVCDLDLTVEGPDGGTTGFRTIDLSLSGICFVGETAFARGTSVVVHLSARMGAAQSDRLSLPARVIWSTPARGGELQTGARFETDVSDLEGTGPARLNALLALLAG